MKPYFILARTSLAWGLGSYLLIGVGAVTVLAGSARGVPLRIGLPLMVAGAVSLIVRGIVLVVGAYVGHRSARRLPGRLPA